MYFLYFWDFFNKIILVLSKRWFTLRYINICSTRVFFLMKVQKQEFLTWKNSKRPQNKKMSSRKKILSDLVSNKTIDRICFMKMLWLFSANWHFQKNIVSGMAFRWSDTPQSKVSLLPYEVVSNFSRPAFSLANRNHVPR